MVNHAISRPSAINPEAKGDDKGAVDGVGEKDDGMNAFVAAFKAVGSQMPPIGDQKASLGVYNIVRPMYCPSKPGNHEHIQRSDPPSRAKVSHEFG